MHTAYGMPQTLAAGGTKFMNPDIDFTKPDDLEGAFKALGRNVAVSRGHWERDNDCEARDLAWNHIDQMHRQHIHGTYTDALRFFRSRSNAVSLTRMRMPLLGIPLWVVVNDIQLGEGLYYQTFTLFNLLHVHMINKISPRANKSREELDWFVVSHKLLKFLHAPLTKRFSGIMQLQSGEDVPIRVRRAALREKGYSFDTDKPDMMNSNKVTSGVIPPRLSGAQRISLDGLEVSARPHRVAAGPVEFLVLRQGPRDMTVWTEVCPHQGGPLSEGRICQDQIECPWHGLKFAGARLTEDKPYGKFGRYELRLENNTLSIEEKEAAAAPRHAL
ncbi:MAG TPA: Rieske (2Fe-2S) protein [Verrucomicrobiae bacterium]|nr:Rieske (2Fe-2S) protein [Verrucomicrobiae bacterium]